jgi:DNA topoisomerase-2
VEEKTIKDFTDNSTDTKVHFNIKLLAPVEDVEKMFKLSVVKSTSNMHLFDASEKLKKYESVADIIEEFYNKRLTTYGDRKTFVMEALENQRIKISNKVNYIKGILSGKLDLRGKKMDVIDIELTTFGLQRLDCSFHYLTKLPMDSVSDENVEKMLKDEKQITTTMIVLTNQTLEEMWNEDLVKLSKAL